MTDFSTYDYDANFDKKRIVELAKKIQLQLNGAGVSSGIWKIQPWEIGFLMQTQRADLADIIFPVYMMAEVVHVHLDVDLATKWPILTVSLHPQWFLQEKSDAKSPLRKLHPESEGGSLA